MKNKNLSELEEAAGILYLEPSFCRFEKAGDFLSCTLCREDETHYKRISLHRMFPYDTPYGYISVLNTESEEIGIIRDITLFGDEVSEYLRLELDRKYYVCKLRGVLSVKDRFGFSYWKAISDDGDVTFTLRDAFNNIRKNSDGTVFITDIDSNSYALPPVETLDAKSRRCVELYL